MKFAVSAGFGVAAAVAHNHNVQGEQRAEELEEQIPVWIDPFEEGAFKRCGPDLLKLFQEHLSADDPARLETETAAGQEWHHCYLTSFRTSDQGLNGHLPRVRAQIVAEGEGRCCPLAPFVVGALFSLYRVWAGVGSSLATFSLLAVCQKEPPGEPHRIGRQTISKAPEAQPIIRARQEAKRRRQEVPQMAKRIQSLVEQSAPQIARALGNVERFETLKKRCEELWEQRHTLANYREVQPLLIEAMLLRPPNFEKKVAKANYLLLVKHERAKRDLIWTR